MMRCMRAAKLRRRADVAPGRSAAKPRVCQPNLLSDAAGVVAAPVNSATPGLMRLIPVGVLGLKGAGALGAAGLVTQRSTPTELNFCTKGLGFGVEGLGSGVPYGWRRCLAKRASRSG